MTEDRPPCRDFQRGDCNRGEKCKYSHPEGGVAAPAADTQDDVKLDICKDFQNQRCSRTNCKFLHLTQEEVVIYNSTGVLPEHGGHPVNTSTAVNNFCKDFMKGMCNRGSQCKFVHTSERSLLGNSASMDGMYGKRFRVEPGYPGSNNVELLEENEILKSKISDLQKQVTNLRQMNDTLYDENTRYRSNLKSSSVTSVSLLQPQTSYPQYSTTVPAYLPKVSNMPAPAPATAMSAYYQQY